MGQKLQRIISENQTAYLKGRMISDNIKSIIATINIGNLKENVKGLIVSLDAKKTFDSVEHSYIKKCLQKTGLQRFIPIFNTLYSDLSMDIKVNGRIV